MRTFRIFPQWFSNDLTDIVFENRNQLYGAYELRKHYPERLKKSLLLTSGLCLLIIGISSWCIKNQPIIDIPLPGTDTVFFDGPKVIIKTSVAAHPLVQTQHQHEDAPKVIVKDSAVDDRKPDTAKVIPMASSSGTGNIADTNNVSCGNNGAQPASGFVPFAASTQDDFIINPSKWPEYPGGQRAMVRYLQKELDCSRLGSNVKGKIYLSFIVNRKGMVTGVEILKDNVGFGCGEQAKKALERMPAWSPGLVNGEPVNVKLAIPISIENN